MGKFTDAVVCQQKFEEHLKLLAAAKAKAEANSKMKNLIREVKAVKDLNFIAK